MYDVRTNTQHAKHHMYCIHTCCCTMNADTANGCNCVLHTQSHRVPTNSHPRTSVRPSVRLSIRPQTRHAATHARHTAHAHALKHTHTDGHTFLQTYYSPDIVTTTKLCTTNQPSRQQTNQAALTGRRRRCCAAMARTTAVLLQMQSPPVTAGERALRRRALCQSHAIGFVHCLKCECCRVKSEV